MVIPTEKTPCMMETKDSFWDLCEQPNMGASGFAPTSKQQGSEEVKLNIDVLPRTAPLGRRQH